MSGQKKAHEKLPKKKKKFKKEIKEKREKKRKKSKKHCPYAADMQAFKSQQII